MTTKQTIRELIGDSSLWKGKDYTQGATCQLKSFGVSFSALKFLRNTWSAIFGRSDLSLLAYLSLQITKYKKDQYFIQLEAKV